MLIANIYLAFAMCQVSSKHLIYVSAFVPHSDPMKYCYYPHFTDKEIEVN